MFVFADRWSYTLTVRRPEVRGQVVEVKTQITSRDYFNMLAQRDPFHLTIFKKRRCFLYNNQYFQLDIYKEPCHPRYKLTWATMTLAKLYFKKLVDHFRCHGLVLLETYTTQTLEEFQAKLPEFLDIVNNVTGEPTHSMYNLSLKEEWLNNKKFCVKLAGRKLFKFHYDQNHWVLRDTLPCGAPPQLLLFLSGQCKFNLFLVN